MPALAPSILVTGGAGFIGSHTAVELARAGFRPVIADNLCNSSRVSIERVRELAGVNDLPFYEADVRDRDRMLSILRDEACEAVIHFAGLKAVGESSERPMEYYSVNVLGTLSLLEAMQAAECRHIVFSSSATVYGNPVFLPYTEDHPLAPINPYGQTKLAAEMLLRDVAASGKGIEAGILRYFNPIGAHASGRMGEDPLGIPNNLMPFVAQVATGRRPELNVFGCDYDTPDGTGVRDYIHVVDLAEAHLAALEHLRGGGKTFTVNIGSGEGHSVLDVVRGFEAASGKTIPLKFAPRRVGDLPIYYADPSKAKELLGWQTRLTLKEMCRDQWAWSSRNPKGYG
jgi:UDP-glucose 4-epimerase